MAAVYDGSLPAKKVSLTLSLTTGNLEDFRLLFTNTDDAEDAFELPTSPTRCSAYCCNKK